MLLPPDACLRRLAARPTATPPARRAHSRARSMCPKAHKKPDYLLSAPVTRCFYFRPSLSAPFLSFTAHLSAFLLFLGPSFLLARVSPQFRAAGPELKPAPAAGRVREPRAERRRPSGGVSRRLVGGARACRHLLRRSSGGQKGPPRDTLRGLLGGRRHLWLSVALPAGRRLEIQPERSGSSHLFSSEACSASGSGAGQK